MSEIPYTHDDLGERDYRAPAGDLTPDRNIDNQEAHPPAYGVGDQPAPYPA